MTQSSEHRIMEPKKTEESGQTQRLSDLTGQVHHGPSTAPERDARVGEEDLNFTLGGWSTRALKNSSSLHNEPGASGWHRHHETPSWAGTPGPTASCLST